MTNKTKTILAYLSVCIFWGSTYIAIRIGVRDFPPMLFAGVRIFVAGIIMLIYAKAKKLKFPETIRNYWRISLVGFFMLTGGTGLLVTAEQWVDASIASIVVAGIPLMMVIIERIAFKGKKISFVTIIGLIIGFGGVIFLALGDSSVAVISLKGILILLAASLFWSIGSVYSKSVKIECSLIVVIGVQMFVAGIGNIAIGAALGEFAELAPSMDSILATIYLIIFGSLVGYSSYIYVLKMWPITKASTYAYVNPIVAIILGALILGETITLKAIIALAIILTGVIIVQKTKSQNTEEL